MADKRTVPGTESYGFIKPTRTSGLETLAKTHEGQSSSFEHAVFAFNPDLSKEQIDAKAAEVRDDQKQVIHEIPPFSIPLKSTELRWSLGKLLPFWKRSNHVKLSNLQIQVVCHAGMHMVAHEFTIALEDTRSQPPTELQVLISTSNKPERIPFSMDFSVPRRDFKRIFLVIKRTSTGFTKGIEWGQLQCCATLTLLKHPKISAPVPVKAVTLLPVGALDDQIYDPTRQDKRFSQTGLAAMRQIKNSIKNETVVDRGSAMVARSAGTIRFGTNVGGYSQEDNDVDSNIDTSDDPLLRLQAVRAEREKEETRKARFASFGNAHSGSPPPKVQYLSSIREEESFRDSWKASMVENTEEVGSPTANPMDVLNRSHAPDPIILGTNIKLDKRVGFKEDNASVRSGSSRFSKNNPFVPLVEAEEERKQSIREGKQRSIEFQFLPKIVD
jgi:hypothetical protein